jgi:CheY-like chemotaxis protein
MMPRRSGYEVCEIVKGDPDLRDTYVIMLTAKGQEVARERGLAAGCDEYLTKPFSPSLIVEKVKIAFEAAEAPEPAPASEPVPAAGEGA